jgi:eukaryotic-like serine/threonine-protein kinase
MGEPMMLVPAADPSRLGRYRLVEKLGDGGMAVIWRAILDGPNGFQREVVIKRIRPSRASDANFRQMLATEARLSAQLHHPSIVQIYDFGELDGDLYLVMERVDGIDLGRLFRACLRRGCQVPVALACYIIGEVASALSYAHALSDDKGQPLQLVHRDVSPSNIMITSFGGVKLLDFGIAKAAPHARPGQPATQAGRLRGTVSYLSPEQASGLPVDGRSDLFSLGVVFHELLTMQRLFVDGPPLEMIQRIRNLPPPPPSSLAPSVPQDVEAVVMKMLARTRDQRFATGDEVAEALLPITRRLGGDAIMLRRLLAEVAPESEERSPPEPSKRTQPLAFVPPASGPARRPRKVMALAWLLALVLALGARIFGDLAPTPSATLAASVTPSPSPAPATVWLAVAGPDGASVTLDGKPLGALPLAVKLPRRGGVRQLEVTHPNFLPWRSQIVAESDLALVAAPRKRPR